MLNKAFKSNKWMEKLIFHSDQGWPRLAIQTQLLCKAFRGKNITQSISRKGNSLDNGLMESFFGIMKSEIFYRQEKNYQNLEELKAAIEEYIAYYNNKRIKVKLKGLTPAEYRNQSSLINN